MKKTLKTAFYLLLVICTFAFLVACSDDPNPEQPPTTDPQTTTTAPDPCAEGHTYGEPEIIKAANCIEAGRQKVKCSICSHELESDIPATDVHEAKQEWDVLLAATRYTEGKKVKKCKVCGIEMQAETIACDLDVDLSSYSIIYDADVTSALFSNSANILSQAIGHSATVNNDTTAAEAKEILIGETNRSESAATLALVDKDGFAITYTDGKIAIVGTNTVQTIYGVNYFIKNYIGENGKATSLPDSVVQTINEVELMSNSSFGYTFLYDADLDDDKSTTNVYGNTKGRDYNCIAVEDLRSLFARSSGRTLSSSAFPKKNDNAAASAKEFIVGAVDRTEYWEIARTIDANEYAIAIKGDKVILAAWNEKAMEICVGEFKKILVDIKKTASGKTVWTLPADFYAKGIAVDAWETDFPRPDDIANIELSRSIDANDDSLQFLYTGSGVSAQAFESYCQTLASAGYIMKTTNTIENSIFRLYVNETKGIVLNVAYNDYKYAADYFSQEKKTAEGKFYVEYEKSIRVTSSPIDSITVPDSNITTPNPTYTKVADSTITALGIKSGYVGMCYIIRLEDGSFVVYDSGLFGAKLDLWNALVNLHTEAYGTAPSESNPIRVSAWIITHAHHDHYSALAHLLRDYGSRSDFKLERIIGSFPSTSMLYPSIGDTSSSRDETNEMNTAGYINAWRDYVAEGATGNYEFIEAFSGQKFYFANLELEVLMTWEDHPSSFFDTNDTSTVTRLSIGSTNTAKGAATSAANTPYTTTILFLGDALRYQSRYMCAMYGSYLESEMVQVAHHANNGCEIELYATVKPKTLLIPNLVPTTLGYLNGTSGRPEADTVGVYLKNNLESMRYIIVSNENYSATISLGTSGPAYEDLYDILSDADLSLESTLDSSWNGYYKKP